MGKAAVLVKKLQEWRKINRLNRLNCVIAGFISTAADTRSVNYDVTGRGEGFHNSLFELPITPFKLSAWPAMKFWMLAR